MNDTLPPSLATMLDQLVRVFGAVQVTRPNDTVFASIDGSYTDSAALLMAEAPTTEAAVEKLWKLVLDAKIITVIHSGVSARYVWTGIELLRFDA